MSSPYNPSEYGAMIDAILSVADLNKISVKRIRNAIQELFDVDLSPHKEEISEAIVDRYHKLAEERELRESVEEDDHQLALQLSKDEGKRHSTRRGSTTTSKIVKRRPRASTGTRGGPNNAFNAELVLSPQLQDIVGSPRMSRPQVVKQMWVYIKDNGLQNPSDKRQIDCDDKLKLLFKKNSVTMFSMNKLLSGHLYKEDEITSRPDDSPPPEDSKPVNGVRSKDDVKREDEDMSDMSDVAE